MSYDGVWFFRADIEGVFCGESVVEYSRGGYVFGTTVVDRVLGIADRDNRIFVDVNVVIFHVFLRN